MTIKTSVTVCSVLLLSGCAKSSVDVYKSMKAEAMMYCGKSDTSTMLNMNHMKIIKCSDGKTYIFQEDKNILQKLLKL